MKKGFLTVVFCLFAFHLSAQCTIDPFIQQNYELDAQLLVLQEIKGNPSDPDYDNPFLEQARVDGYLEKLSAIYSNPQNLADIDSLFTEFQFHVNAVNLPYKKMEFRVQTSVSWVQTLKDTGQSGVTELDNFLSQYQFTVTDFFDFTFGNSAGTTKFELTTAHNFINTYALFDDLQNSSSAIEDVFEVSDYSVWCNYTGIPYTVEEYALPPADLPVNSCSISKSNNATSAEDVFIFSLGKCFHSGYITDYRYVTVPNDCSSATFSRTLSTSENELINVSIYPNPTSNTLHIKGIPQIETVEIYSILGKKIEVSITNSTTVDVSTLTNGIYFLKVVDTQNRTVIKKFIKK
ncbi:MAG: T9SS type A sorting domain-containing protein [Kordia sp.]|uniref:T9SS type A sorting domain-containing protein n=1 Tax=Kordia sp. TaxID=1965332 RepID=UPI00385F5775